MQRMGSNQWMDAAVKVWFAPRPTRIGLAGLVQIKTKERFLGCGILLTFS